MLADLLTPVSAYLCVAEGVERAFLLESVEGGEKVGRYSFIGVNPRQSYQGDLAGFRAQFGPPSPPHSELPPFTGGAVGAFSYDLVRELEDLPNLNPAGPVNPAPVTFDLYSTVLAFDHLKHRIVLMSREGPAAIEELEAKLRTPVQPALEPSVATPPQPVVAASSSFSQSGFCAAVERAQQHILAGDIFQVVLSQRFEVDYADDPFKVYRALRFINPSPYLFFLKQGPICVAGSSPEMLLRVNRTSLSYRPIAGTRRRGRNQEEDLQLQQELLADEKERAEHLMLVDLGRNDLGKVSRFGSVRVDDFMFIEKYSHVFHLVSSLTGELRPELDRFDALAACFPAGTVTGAPKVRAMELIEEIEPVKRGLYAGAIGYLDHSGNLDSCIAIRTIVFQQGRAYLQAGAGVVADSRPELEYKECRNKARALFRAIELASTI